MAKERKFKFKDLFNLFDIVVLALALVLGAAVLLISKGAGQKEITVRYLVEFTNMQNNTAELIQVGDELEDRVKKYDLGKVISVEVGPTVNYLADQVNGGSHDQLSQTLQTATVVLEATATDDPQSILVSGGYLIKIGTGVSAKGPGYSCYGTVLAIEIVEEGENNG